MDFVDPDWRHGAPFPDDPPLSLDGVEQARETGLVLAKAGIESIYSSPFQRCIQTAAGIAEVLDMPFNLEWGLSEWFNPVWFQGPPRLLIENGLADSYPRIARSHQSLVNPHYPETKVEMFERVGRTARELAAKGSGDSLWVGHGASVQGAAAGLLGVPPEEADHIFSSVPCCSLARLVETPSGWRLEGDCDSSHLSEEVAGERFR